MLPFILRRLLQAVLVANPTANEWVDARDALIGISAPLGGGSLMASGIKHNDRTATNKDASQLGVGYMYPLSKRTSLYTSFARISNKNGAQLTVGNATEAGSGNKAIDLGVVHNF